MTRPTRLLRWIYVGRMMVALVVFAGAYWLWRQPPQPEIAGVALAVTVAFTLVSVWWTEVWGRPPGQNYLYVQVVYDALLVTVVVHVTGASADFAPLYVLVIAAGAVLLPVPGGWLIAALSSVLYVGDIIWQLGEPPTSVLVQIGLFGVMAVVTGFLGDRLRRAGAELGEVQSELRQLRLDTTDILAALDTGVVTVDGGGSLVYINAAAERILGVVGESWMGRPVLAELDRRAPGAGAILQRTAVTRVPVTRFEASLGASDGRRRVLGVRTTVLDRESTPWVTAVCQDITEGKRLEELHRRAERLEALGEMSASLAHEIKNPLASIRSSIEQLSSPALGAADRATLEGLVLKESDRLSRLLSEFIDYSRIELGRPSPIDLGAVVTEAVELARRHPDGERGQVDLALPDEPIFVHGDRDLLHRAVFNLVLNGVQHSAGGVVRVDMRAARTDELPSAIELPLAARVRVTDSGPGISTRNLPRVFDPFFTTRPAGTGLGLALVHRAVEAHGGAIFVDGGGEGKGATFTVYLPRAVHAGADAVSAAEA